MTNWQTPAFELINMNAEIGAYQEEVLSRAAFAKRLHEQAARYYHDQHPFHRRMHVGELSRAELQAWALNRYYYQTRIPIKDAVILGKAEDPDFRRVWLERIRQQDGDGINEGGLALWRKFAVALGVDASSLTKIGAILPGVRFACDGYVAFVKSASLLEAVAASLTETLAPELMRERLRAFENHYSWVPNDALAYFRGRVRQASDDGAMALAYVLDRAATPELQDACVAALLYKTRVLWHLLDCVQADTAARRGSA